MTPHRLAFPFPSLWWEPESDVSSLPVLLPPELPPRHRRRTLFLRVTLTRARESTPRRRRRVADRVDLAFAQVEPPHLIEQVTATSTSSSIPTSTSQTTIPTPTSVPSSTFTPISTPTPLSTPSLAPTPME